MKLSELTYINSLTPFRYGGNAKVVHFLGKTKPWSYTFEPKAKRIAGSGQEAATHGTFLLDWWTLYSDTVVPMLQKQYGDQPFHSGCIEVSQHHICSVVQSCTNSLQHLRFTYHRCLFCEHSGWEAKNTQFIYFCWIYEITLCDVHTTGQIENWLFKNCYLTWKWNA